MPHSLFTHVETTQAPISDEGAISTIHADLAEKDLLPDQQLVDSGYVTSANLVKARSDCGVDLVGPTLKTRLLSSGDRLRPHALRHRLGSGDRDLSTGPDLFKLDRGPGCRQIADQGEVFGIRDCKVCPALACCTGTTRRTLTLHPKEQMQALFAARKREETDEFKDTYRHRAGIDPTHSEASPQDGLAPLTLYRSAQNASGPCGSCYGDQRCSTDELVARRSTGTNSYLFL